MTIPHAPVGAPTAHAAWRSSRIIDKDPAPFGERERETKPKRVIAGTASKLKKPAIQEGLRRRGVISASFEGADVPSGVSECPATVPALKRGAYNRVQNAQAILPGRQVGTAAESGRVPDDVYKPRAKNKKCFKEATVALVKNLETGEESYGISDVLDWRDFTGRGGKKAAKAAIRVALKFNRDHAEEIKSGKVTGKTPAIILEEWGCIKKGENKDPYKYLKSKHDRPFYIQQATERAASGVKF